MHPWHDRPVVFVYKEANFTAVLYRLALSAPYSFCGSSKDCLVTRQHWVHMLSTAFSNPRSYRNVDARQIGGKKQVL